MFGVELSAPVRVLFEPFDGGFEGGSIARHAEASLAHEIDVVRVATEAPGEFFYGEELGVVIT